MIQDKMLTAAVLLYEVLGICLQPEGSTYLPTTKPDRAPPNTSPDQDLPHLRIYLLVY